MTVAARGASCLFLALLVGCRSPSHIAHPVVEPGRESAAAPSADDAPLACSGGSDPTTTVALPGGVVLELVRVPAGALQMGSPESEPGRWPDERQHAVTIGHDFLLGKFAVTQAQWQAVMGGNPSHFSHCGGDCPVDSVSWRDCGTFAQRLNARVGCGFRLPSEAEWEYACRAGSSDASVAGQPDANAWYSENADARTHPVGQKAPNAWGFYDMLGNVWQWCEDRYMPDAASTPGASQRGTTRVVRGGSFGDNGRSARCAARDSDGPDVRLPLYGCRIARSL